MFWIWDKSKILNYFSFKLDNCNYKNLEITKASWDMAHVTWDLENEVSICLRCNF